jgi:hypothetical protein
MPSRRAVSSRACATRATSGACWSGSLTDEAQAWLAEEREVLDRARVAAALSRMTPSDRAALLDGMRALVRAADEAAATNSSTTQPKRRRR